MTTASVNGLLRRARATMHSDYQSQAMVKLDAKLRRILDRYVEAWETGDMDGLIALLRDKAIFAMPPSPTWYVGRESIRLHAEKILAGGAQQWRLIPTHANGQVAFGCYRRDEHDGSYHAYALQVLTLEAGQIADMQMFMITTLFPRFGLEMTLNK